MSDLHEVVFRWPYNANEVIVTGTFDQWSRSVRLNKGPSGFTATIRVPWGERVLYKFIVDGRWSTIDQAPTEADWRGNINNIYNAPTKPQEVDTPRYEPPVAQKPKIAPVPTPVPVEEKKKAPTPTPTPASKPAGQGSVEVPAKPKEPVKDLTPVVSKDKTLTVDRKDQTPAVDKKDKIPIVDKDPTPIVGEKDQTPIVGKKDRIPTVDNQIPTVGKKDQTPTVDKKDRIPTVDKEPSPPVDVKVIPSVPEVAPTPVAPVKDTKPVDTPPAKTEVAAPDKAPTVLPTPASLKAPLVIVPVNDASTVDKRPPTVESLKHTDTPSTHTLPINSPRKASTGTSSSNTLLSEKKDEAEKKEEEKKEPKPEEVPRPNGTSNGVVKAETAKQPPSTPVKVKTPTLPTTPVTPSTFSSPPTTPKKPYFSGSPSSTPTSSPGRTLSRKSSFKKKRDSLISKIKHLFNPEKDKEKEHKREKSHG